MYIGLPITKKDVTRELIDNEYEYTIINIKTVINSFIADCTSHKYSVESATRDILYWKSRYFGFIYALCVMGRLTEQEHLDERTKLVNEVQRLTHKFIEGRWDE